MCTPDTLIAMNRIKMFQLLGDCPQIPSGAKTLSPAPTGGHPFQTHLNIDILDEKFWR